MSTDLATDAIGESPVRGRPRDADRTAAILDAAVEVMHDEGWDGFTMQAVAQQAGAGLATIYRRFATKEDLVAAAMRHDAEVVLDLAPSDDPRATLSTLLTTWGDKMCSKGGSVISVLAAARDHEVMQQALDDVIKSTVRVAVLDAVDQVIGPDNPLSSTVCDAILGTMIFQAGILEEVSTGESFADEMLALVDALAPKR